MTLHDLVVVMDRVHVAALRVPASEARQLAVYGIQQTKMWAINICQLGEGVGLAAMCQQARASARTLRVQVLERDAGDVDAVLRAAFAAAGSAR